MFCGTCGKKVSEDARFCPFCGMPTTTKGGVAPSEEHNQENEAFEGQLNAARGRSKRKMPMALLVTLIVVALAGTAFAASMVYRFAVLPMQETQQGQVMNSESLPAPVMDEAVTEDSAPQEEQEPVQEEPSYSIPSGTFSYVAGSGGFRGSLTIDSSGTAKLTEVSAGSGRGTNKYYNVSVDEASSSDGEIVLILTSSDKPGENFQIGQEGVISTFTTSDTYTFVYNATNNTVAEAQAPDAVWASTAD